MNLPGLCQMLLQTNSYIVPKERRAEHARLLRRFRQVLMRLGCDLFEVYEQMGPNWTAGDGSGRFVQIMRFRDRKHQREVHASEQSDPAAQQLIAEFCELVNLPYQQQQGLLAIGYYQGVMDVPASAILKQSTPGQTPAIPPQSPNPALRKRTETKPQAAFGFGVPPAAAAAVAPAAAIGFGGATFNAQPDEVSEEEATEEPTDETAAEAWSAESESEEPAEQSDESAEVELDLQEGEEDLAVNVPPIAVVTPKADTEPDEPELSGLDFSDELTESAFAASPEEPEDVAGAAASTPDVEDNVEAVLDGLDFSELAPMESSGLDTFALDSLDAENASAGDAIGSLEAGFDTDSIAESDAELESSFETSEDPLADAGFASHESQEAVGFNLIPAASAEEAFHDPEVEVPVEAAAESEAALSSEPGLEFSPESFTPDEETHDEELAPAATELDLAHETFEPTAAQQPEGSAESEFELESLLGTPGEVETSEMSAQELGQATEPEADHVAETNEFSIPEHATEEIAPADVASEPAEADAADRMFGLESEPAAAELGGEVVASSAAEAPTDFSADAAFAIPPAAPIEPVAAAINGEHQHLPEENFETADLESAEVQDLPMHLVTDEGEIEILYEEFPEDFQEDAEAESVGGDDEIEAALNEALRD